MGEMSLVENGQISRKEEEVLCCTDTFHLQLLIYLWGSSRVSWGNN